MKGFIPVTDDELLEVSGRGGGSSTPSYGSQGSSTVEKTRTDEAIGAREVSVAKQLVAAKVPYGSSNTGGTVNSLGASSYDCTGVMSAVTGKPYQTSASLMDPAVQKASGYVNAVSNSQAGTWTVVQYRDPKTGKIEGHVQMTMGDGTYFDSVPASKPNSRSGPSTSNTSTLDYLKSQGIQPISVAYLRPNG